MLAPIQDAAVSGKRRGAGHFVPYFSAEPSRRRQTPEEMRANLHAATDRKTPPTRRK